MSTTYEEQSFPSPREIEIVQMAVFSTSHISHATSLDLAGRHEAIQRYSDGYEYGWNIWVQLDWSDYDEQVFSPYPELVILMKWVQKNLPECQYLRLDCDGEVYDGFEVFEW